MTMEHFFNDGIWVGQDSRHYDTFSVLYGKFEVGEGCRATLNVLGLGFFKCYINGVCINPHSFLPLSSEYEASDMPKGEILSEQRIYVPVFDITPYVKSGENIIAIHFGGGWYCSNVRRYGLPKAIYCIRVDGKDGERIYSSSEECLISESYVSAYDFTTSETHDYSAISPRFDTIPEGLKNAVATEALNTQYTTTDCPVDALINSRTPSVVARLSDGTVYDAGANLTGYPVIKIPAGEEGEVVVTFSEAVLDGGDLDPSHMHGQSFSVKPCKQEIITGAEFTWFGFRYFKISGNATPISVSEVHADVKRASSFECSDKTLNWTYETFIHTMLCNMHTGHPSDCPHIERRGYTGDGQLTTHAVLSTLSAKSFYEKWVQDIADSQDKLSGHIQYTAPYVRSGGGPGGWGCAIVEVPYQMYLHYGDKEILAKYYRNMQRYIDYLEDHSEFGLVTSDKEGEWCLGDWCGPNILYPELDITSHNQQVVLPAPMVNTYFMVKTLERLCEIARIIGKDEDIDSYREKAKMRKRAISAAYFNAFDSNFIMNIQGANAFAVDIGLGNSGTYSNLVRYYKKLGHYDTGIFGTDILTRVLFERGDHELAIELLTANGAQGYEHWRRNGATTFHEYWDSNRSRSHNHPMFGATVAYFFEYLLGIRQSAGTAGYSSLIISPVESAKIEWARGSMEIPAGTVEVSYKRFGGKTEYIISVPSGISAVFKLGEYEKVLEAGKSTVEI